MSGTRRPIRRSSGSVSTAMRPLTWMVSKSPRLTEAYIDDRPMPTSLAACSNAQRQREVFALHAHSDVVAPHAHADALFWCIRGSCR